MGVFIVLIFILIIYLSCAIVCGFCINCDLMNARFIAKLPLLCCGCCAFLIFLAVGTSLLVVRKAGEEAIEYACEDEDTGEDSTTYLQEFFSDIYDKMDTFYCQSIICECKIDAGTFDDADADDVAYYAALDGTDTETINFQWCADAMVDIANDYDLFTT
jgi:hypothetical protein